MDDGETMQVRFFATIREITQQQEIQWCRPSATLGELLNGLCARYGNKFRSWTLDGDELGKSIIILINGRDCRHQAGIRTQLHSDDTVSIFPMVAGG